MSCARELLVLDPVSFFPTRQVRKNERKAFADKQQDEEWLSYELRAYRSRCRELRDERDHLQVFHPFSSSFTILPYPRFAVKW